MSGFADARYHLSVSELSLFVKAKRNTTEIHSVVFSTLQMLKHGNNTQGLNNVRSP